MTLALLAVPCALCLAVANWRWALYGLLVFLPVSGVPAILARYNPNSATAVALSTLVKDFLFVLPAYLGFTVARLARRQAFSFPGAPTLIAGGFAVLVVAEIFIPHGPSLAVALIGAKVWLFYIPLLYLGYHFVRDDEDLERVVAVISIVGLLPVLVGLVEATFLYTGREQLVYNLYGQGAAGATQDYAGLAYSSGQQVLRRVPSTFTFFTQYFGFLLVMTASVWVWWRAFLRPRGRGWLGAGLWALVLAAAFLSGSRNAFISIPILIALTIFLERRRLPQVKRGTLYVLCLALILAGVVGKPALLNNAVTQVDVSARKLLLPALRQVSSGPIVAGVGPGSNTLAARIIDPTIAQRRVESWLLKAIVELGIVGFALILLLIGSVLVRAIRNHAHLVSEVHVTASAAFVALFVVIAYNTLKGFMLDEDPVNAYFWLLAGISAKVARLDRAYVASAVAQRGERSAEPAWSAPTFVDT